MPIIKESHSESNIDFIKFLVSDEVSEDAIEAVLYAIAMVKTMDKYAYDEIIRQIERDAEEIRRAGGK